jgi:hypothetical protein
VRTSEIRLQERDLELFRLLCWFGYLGIEHIEKQIFCTSYKRTADRLCRLRKNGYLIFLRRRDGLGSRVYTPNLKKLVQVLPEDLIERGQTAFEYKPWFRPSQHEDLVRYWALRVLNWFPEVEIELDFHLFKKIPGHGSANKDEIKKLPDFSVKFAGSAALLNVEIELTDKGKERYQKIIRSILINAKVPVFYLAANEKIQRTVQFSYESVLAGMGSRGQILKSKINISDFLGSDFKEVLSEIIEGAKSQRIGNPQELVQDKGLNQVRGTSLEDYFN